MASTSEKPALQPQEPIPALEKGKMPERGDIEEQPKVTEDTVGKQRTKISAQAVEMNRLRDSRRVYARKYKSAKEQVAVLDLEMKKMSRTHQEALEKKDQRIKAIEEDLARTKELLDTRTKELSGAQPFLSTADRTSEAEVLGIARDLNENIFQVATNLAEEWEKFTSSRSRRYNVSRKSIDNFSNFYGPVLVHRTFYRDDAAVALLIQSCLCYLVTQITSSWRRSQPNDNERLRMLASLYERLSISQPRTILARWRSLTHGHLAKSTTRYDPPSIVEHVGYVFWITGSFETAQAASEFVKKKAFNKIETIHRLAVRLESVFMVDITSCDMYLLCETPRAAFNSRRMTNEFESDKSSPHQTRDRVAGTTEVGVGRCVGKKRGDSTCMDILSKVKVVLEKDLASDSEDDR